MIEGVRVHPSYSYAQLTGKVPKSCADCKATQTVTTRQDMACPYEPRTVKHAPWIPPSWRKRPELRLDSCPGYTTALPAVHEVTMAHPQWKAGALVDYLDGETPTRQALDLFAIYDVALEEFSAEREAEAIEAARSKP